MSKELVLGSHHKCMTAGKELDFNVLALKVRKRWTIITFDTNARSFSKKRCPYNDVKRPKKRYKVCVCVVRIRL